MLRRLGKGHYRAQHTSNRWARCTLAYLQIEALFKLVPWLCRGMKSTWLRLAHSVKYYFEAEPHRLLYEAEPRNEKEVVSFQRKQKSRSLYYQLRWLDKGSSRAQHTSNRWVRCTLPNLQIEVPSHQIVWVRCTLPNLQIEALLSWIRLIKLFHQFCY